MNAPAFQFYAGDWLSSQRVALMTLEQEGAYIRLMAFCWKHGSIPAGPETLARLIGKGASTTLASEVAKMFQPSGETLIHPRLEQAREEQAAWRAKSSEGGKKSAETRRARKAGKGASTTLQPPIEGSLQNGSNHSATLHSSSSPSITPNPQGGFSLSPEVPTGEADNSPLMIRIGKFFNRRPNTRWNSDELKALKRLMPIATEDLDLLERWFSQIPEQGEEIYRRKALPALLNNWNAELDMANGYFADKKFR
jgi:uncharacterized protein YdaU (DUF1376 family)